MLFNKSGRPCVLIVKLKYKGEKHQFVVPLRSNIPANVPKDQYFSLPRNSTTKSKTGIRNIIAASQNYLYECEQGRKDPNTPDIDGILSWL